MNRAVTFLALLWLTGIPVHAQSAAPPAPAVEDQAAQDQDEQFAQIEREYTIYFLSRFPVVATYLGGSAFDPALADIDGRLRDHSPQALKEEDARWVQFKAQFEALKPESLSARRRVDRAVALAQIDFLLRQHQVHRHQERALDTYVDEPFRGIEWQIQHMTPTTAGKRGTDAEWKQVIARVNAIPPYLAAAEQQLAAGVESDNTPDWRIIIQYGARLAAANAAYFSSTLPETAEQNMSSAEREMLLGELHAAAKKAAEAYTHLRDFVMSTFVENPRRPGAESVKAPFRADRYALGEEEYDWALKNNLRIHESAAQLFEASGARIEATRKEMVALARQIAESRKLSLPEDDSAAVRLVFDQLSLDAPKSDEQIVVWYRSTGERLVEYARRIGFFDVPSIYRLDVTTTPAFLRSVIDGAAYYPAPPFSTAGVGRFHVSPANSSTTELRKHHRAAVTAIAAHEGFPGHDWQFRALSESRAEISPIRWLIPGGVEDSSSMWQDVMALEGWAVYAEELIGAPQGEARFGFYTPEERLYQLRGQLYREVRMRVDLGIHTGRMTFDDGVSLYSETVDFLPGACHDENATRDDAKRVSCQVARGNVLRDARLPMQGVAYGLGKEPILALRKRAEEALGEKFSVKRFHAELMKQGPVPAGYFDDELLSALTE